MKKRCTVKELIELFDAFDPDMTIDVEERCFENDDGFQYHELKVFIDVLAVNDRWDELKKADSRMRTIDQFLYDDKMLRDQELSFDEKPF